MRDKISQYETDLRILEHKITQIDIAMSVLDGIDKRIVKECYINHRYYYQAGELWAEIHVAAADGSIKGKTSDWSALIS